METLHSVTDEDALRKAVETHGPMVLSLAWRIAGDRCAAEEVMQDVFVELWRTQTRFASEFHLRCWLRSVAAHRATDLLRRRMRQPTLVCDERLEETLEDGHSNGAAGRGSVPFPVESRMGALLHSLPATMRAAVVLRYGEEELSPDEIAALLEQPVATVKSNLQRALALLRRKAGMTLKEFVRHA